MFTYTQSTDAVNQLLDDSVWKARITNSTQPYDVRADHYIRSHSSM